jgi:rhamnose transport system substrate-binding protein
MSKQSSGEGARFLWAIVAMVIGGSLLAGCGAKSESTSGAKRLKIGMMPKLVGIAYFNACERGAQEAAKELGVELVYDGPAVDRVEEQVKIVDRWIAQGFDVIAVAPNDPEVIAPALRRAKQAGITVLTWDADANPASSGRATFVNQAPIDGIGQSLVDVLAEQMGGKGKAVIVTGSATSPNQNAWMKAMHARLAERYPDIALLETLVSDEDQAKAGQLSRDVLASQPDLAGIWAITSMALPAAAKAVRDSGRSGKVAVTGLSVPSTMREFVKDGTVARFVLWNPVDLGYLTVQVAKRAAEEQLAPGEHTFGRLAGVQVAEGEVLLGPPVIFDKSDIDQFEF